MYPQLANRIFNRCHLIEPAAGRTLIGALGRRLDVDSVQMPDGAVLDAEALAETAGNTQRREGRPLFERLGNVAVIRATGTLVHRFGHLDPVSGMSGYDGLEAKLDAAMDDATIEGIIFDIDSPGGEVAGCFDLCDRIYAARADKPIWALADEQACSAAYAIASACTRIVAPGTARIGSVGVLTAHCDQSAMLKGAGLDVTLIYAGEHKVDGNPYAPLAPDVRENIQGEIDALYERFVGLVARNRGISANTVRDTGARVYDTAGAVEVGLADAVMPSRDVLNAFNSSLRRGGGVSFANIKERSMALFNRNRQADTDEKVYTEAEARAAFASGADAASLESLVSLCGDKNLASLAKPLHDRGVTQEQAEAVMMDASDVRDRLAATFPVDINAATTLADQFIVAAYSGDTPRFGPAIGALMVDAAAVMSGEEIDHHPPAGYEQGGSAFNPEQYYR
ncbi:S49 family peptidase [Salinisphaera japonica]|uniref:Capsid assembly protein n=1 Tax=Salinisphaera japonica YTM-1 TaxID=1209778 RepID=A0A423Q1A1_9GAMM|nr:S49 family peptidase [Salinisphaera japonica]ROO31956.1 capsid assembly protein [Salinisphaera japonica YTM-1]